MALNVDKEVEWLTTEILPQILKNGRLVDNYNESQLSTFKVGDIKIAVIGPEEAYMFTQCYRATINFELAGERQQRKFVVKKTPEVPPEIYKNTQLDDLFHNEIGFYTGILPLIQKLSNGAFAAPKYYYSEIKPNFALIILGDFAEDGWTLTKDRFGLSLEHARIAGEQQINDYLGISFKTTIPTVKYLGRFHGFGYAIKHKENERFQELSRQFRESRYANDDIFPEYKLVGDTAIERLAKATSIYQPGVDKNFIKKFQQLVNVDSMDYGRQRVAPREPLSTLCHGDYLRNNVAYKYDTDSSGTPVDIMMFDYQTMRLCSPMVDLSVFLANSVLADVRYAHFDTIFDDYSTALSDSYTKHAEQEHPEFLNRENLLKEYIRFLPYAVSISSYFLMILVDPPKQTISEMVAMPKPQEEVIQETWTMGGELVDREIAHQMMEMFELSRLHNVQIDEDIDTTNWIKSAAIE